MNDYREILRLSSQGVSQRDIAVSCGCSRNTIAKVLIGVIDRENRVVVAIMDDGYVLTRDRQVDLMTIKGRMKGLRYVLMAETYLFRRIKRCA